MPLACDAHHIVAWADGGATRADNLVLVCRRHHTLLHTSPWQVRINPADGRPEFKPPPHAHAVPGWIRDQHPPPLVA
jgi:hypothetical protein